MHPQKQHFLFVLLLTFIVRSQVLNPFTNCLGNCANCVANDLSLCSGAQPCEWGFYAPTLNASCAPTPSKQVVWSQLGERKNRNEAPLSESWGEATKQSTCEYTSPQGKRTIDALGLFSGVTMLEKTIPIDSHSQVFSLSFNLLRDEWLPFNDFLLVDVSSNEQSLNSIEISYEKRIKVESQAITILCSGKRVLSEKFTLKIVNNNNLGNTLTLVFTSFLYNSLWGLTNLKLVAGCTQFSSYDAPSESCSTCDTDSYSVAQGSSEKWCEKCPSLCRTCEGRNNCTTCLDGAVLLNGICVFGEGFKTQQITTSSSLSQCGAYSYYPSASQMIVFEEIKNEGNQLFDEIQLGFRLHYSPLDWTDSNNKISIKINKVESFTITAANLTNRGTITCNSLALAVIQILSPKKIQNDNTVNVTFQYVGKDKELKFGVSNLTIKSIKKPLPNEPNGTVDVEEVAPQVEEPKKAVKVVVVPEPSNTTNAQIVLDVSNLITPNITSHQADNSSTKETIPIPITQPIVPQIPDINEITKEDASPVLFNTSSPSINIENDILIPKQTVESKPIANLVIQPQTVVPTIVLPPPSPSPLPQSSTQKAPTKYSQVSYVPSSNNDKSGLHIVVTQPAAIQNSAFSVTVDKLDSSAYSLNDTYVLDGDLHLFIAISTSFIDSTITVYKQPLTARLLQANKGTVLAVVSVNRYDSLSSGQLSSISSFATVFQVLAWVGCIGIIIAVLSGYGIVLQEYVICLQLIFLHAYIASDYLPLTFRDVIGGLSNIENLNFFLPAHGLTIEKSWLGNVVQNGPVRFFLFNTDINFSRQFYPIIIINLLYLAWFAALVLVRRVLQRRGLLDEEKPLWERAIDNIVCRPINYIDQIWRYQFLATIWFCFLQFYNLRYPSGSDRSEVANAVLCILSLLASLAWPAFLSFHSRKYYYENEYSDYLQKFEDLHYLRIPEFYLPSNHHRFGYPLFRAAKTLLSALVVAYLGSIASLALVLLILLQLAEVGYAKYHEIYSDSRYFAHRLIENVLLAMVQLILLFLCSFSSLALTESYVYIGFVLAALCLLLALNALGRVFCLCVRKYRQATSEQQWGVQVKQPKTERVV